ncbi:MAG: NAD(P)H-dependent oxidoreductase [Anaerolineae bacterium]|nr:NAD(P)H-dependent oxidoreductase [Anaerolineae bacterium]
MLAKELHRKRALGVVGSPRYAGNTEILVDEVLRGAQDAGAQTEKVILNQLNIAPCQACGRCMGTGECAQRDDMPALLEQMKQSQIWVLGTPVYWSGPTAQFKAFLDRWYSARQVDFEKPRVVLVMPMGEPNVAYADCTVQTVKTALAYLKVELFSVVPVPDVWDLSEVRERPDALEAAYRAGREATEIDLSQARADAGEEAVLLSSEPDSPEEATLWLDDLAKMTCPRLVVTGAPIPLLQDEVLIGRVKPEVTPVPDVDLVPHGGDRMGVSRHHARMLRGSGGWVLEDLESTNGTFLNGEQVPPGQQVRVRTGDLIRFGTLTLIFYE